MYVVTVEFRIMSGHEDEFRKAVLAQAHNSLTRESRCHRFDVCEDPELPGRFFLYEIYDDADAFRAHLDSNHFHDFDRKVRAWVKEKNVETWRLAAPE